MLAEVGDVTVSCDILHRLPELAGRLVGHISFWQVRKVKHTVHKVRRQKHTFHKANHYQKTCKGWALIHCFSDASMLQFFSDPDEEAPPTWSSRVIYQYIPLMQ